MFSIRTEVSFCFKNILLIILKVNSNQNLFKILNFVGSRTLDVFSYERNTQVYCSCSVLLSGKMLLIGGTDDFARQVSSVGLCNLKTEGTLPFDLFAGAANTVDGVNGAESALLCFDFDSTNACYSYVNISYIILAILLFSSQFLSH